MALLKQSTARNRMVFMTSSTDHISGATGLTLTITASKNGGALGSITPTVTEIGNGWYALALDTTMTNTLGDLALHITSTGADPTDLVDQVVLDLPGASVSSVTGAVGSVTGNVGGISGVTFPTNFSTLVIDTNGRVKALVGYTKDVAATLIFYVTDATGAPITGLTDVSFTTKTYAIAGGASGALSGTITEISATNAPGFYQIPLSAAELNGNEIAYVFQTATSLATAVTIIPAQ